MSADENVTEEPVADEAAVDEAQEAELEVDEIDQLKGEITDLRERMLRQQAEFDNTRKRLRREMEEAGNRALVRFIRPLLTEMDNFEHALLAANPEAFQDFAMGVSMIKTNLDSILNGSGIQPIPSEGVFDPARHEVVQEIDNPELAKGTIIEVVRTGYQIGNQVIRAAQVMVAKGPAVAEEAADEPEAEADDGQAADAD